MSETRRQIIARRLREGPSTVLDLARATGFTVKNVLSDLEHVLRSARVKSKVVIREPECLDCGHVFHGRTRVETPSRCPLCRSEGIRDPEFSIEDR